MAKRHPLKITVIKRLSSKEVYGYPLPEVSETMAAYPTQTAWVVRCIACVVEHELVTRLALFQIPGASEVERPELLEVVHR